MVKKGRFIFDERPAKASELIRLIKLSEIYQLKMKNLFSKYKDFNFKRIIDIGAGTGHTTILLKELFPQSQVIYYDMSEELLHYAKNLASKKGVELNFIKGNILNPIRNTDKYDLVFSRFALKHIFDPKLAMENMVSMLKDNGVILLIDKDVSANIWFPRFPLYKTNYMEALNKYNQYNNRGGDATIGRKLSYILKNLGINDIKVEAIGRNLVENKNKDYGEIMIEVYKNLVPELVNLGYITEDLAYKDIKKLKTFLHKEGNLAFVFDFIVTGVKSNG